jgi:hypothetical protein
VQWRRARHPDSDRKTEETRVVLRGWTAINSAAPNGSVVVFNGEGAIRKKCMDRERIFLADAA